MEGKKGRQRHDVSIFACPAFIVWCKVEQGLCLGPPQYFTWFYYFMPPSFRNTLSSYYWTLWIGLIVSIWRLFTWQKGRSWRSEPKDRKKERKNVGALCYFGFWGKQQQQCLFSVPIFQHKLVVQWLRFGATSLSVITHLIYRAFCFLDTVQPNANNFE